jgi:hypothetical protein
MRPGMALGFGTMVFLPAMVVVGTNAPQVRETEVELSRSDPLPALDVVLDSRPASIPGPLRGWPIDATTSPSPSERLATQVAPPVRHTVTGDAVALRVAPNIRARVVLRLYKGDEVDELRRQITWALVRLPLQDLQGWVHTRYLEAQDPDRVDQS